MPPSAVGAQVLARIEAEAAGVAEAADRAVLVDRAVRLARVLDHLEPVALGDLEDGVHVGRVAVEMDRHDRLRLRRDLRLDLVDVHRERDRIDVDEHRRAPV
jgi:hypothetical protein